MLGKDFGREEGPTDIAALGHDTGVFGNEIRQDAGVADRNRAVAVGHDKGHGIALAAHKRALLDQAADAEDFALGRHIGEHLGRRAEEVDPLAKAIADQDRRHDERHRHEADHLDPLFLAKTLHLMPPRT